MNPLHPPTTERPDGARDLDFRIGRIAGHRRAER